MKHDKPYAKGDIRAQTGEKEDEYHICRREGSEQSR